MEKYGWEPVGIITTAFTALTNQQRKVQNIENVVNFDTTAMRFDLTIATAEFAELRLLAIGADGDTNVAEIYAARDENDDYTHVGQLTATVGTMIVRGGTRLYHDTFVWVATDEGFELVVTNSTNNDTAKAWFNTNGYKKILVVMSALASTSVVAEIAFSDRIELPGQLAALDLINTNLEASLVDNSGSGGTQKLTIATNVVVGADQECTSALVSWDGTGPVYVNSGATADVNDFRLPTESAGVGQPIAFPVRNTNQLNFFSGTNGDFVRIFWRS